MFFKHTKLKGTENEKLNIKQNLKQGEEYKSKTNPIRTNQGKVKATKTNPTMSNMTYSKMKKSNPSKSNPSKSNQKLLSASKKLKNAVKILYKIITKLTILLFIGLFCAAIMIVSINLRVIQYSNDRIVTIENAVSIKADCILVLGAGVYGNERPSNMLEDRLLQGIALYKAGCSNRLLMSGDHGQDNYNEVKVMKNFAIAAGIPSENIFMDHAGFSTYESIFRAKNIFKANKIIVVTQGYHLYRAVYIAGKLGLEVHGMASDQRTHAGQSYRDAREALARTKDFFNSIFKPDPMYLGETIPITGNGDVTDIEKSKQ